MQGVLLKRHVLSHPWLVIRQFGFGMFVDLLASPADATFLEVLARYEFKQQRKAERKLVTAVDAEAEQLQSHALSMVAFSHTALVLLNRVVALEERLDRFGQKKTPDTDPLLQRFKAMLQSLASAGGPVRAALGTLSPTELMAVEMRVLNATRKRYADAVGRDLQHARTRLEVVRSHLIRLLRQADDGERAQWQQQLSASAQKFLA